MANVKDLIVNGAARIIGKLYASEFVGNLNGTASIANKLGTSDIGDTTTPIYLSAGIPKVGRALATVATSGSYSDLSGTPSLATVATSGSYSDLSGTPSLATVATSGSYTDLSNKPSLATVATSGSYTDLSNKPDSILNFGSSMSFGDGTTVSLPSGMDTNTAYSWKKSSGSRDTNIMYSTQDGMLIANSGDCGYVFAVYNTDVTTDGNFADTSAPIFKVNDTGGNSYCEARYGFTAPTIIATSRFTGNLTGNVTGNADTASVINGTYTGNGGAQPPSYIGNGKVRFNMMNKFPGLSILPTYADCILMDTYTGSDVPYVTGLGIIKAAGNPRAFIAVGEKNNTTTWKSQAELITTANVASSHTHNYAGSSSAGGPATDFTAEIGSSDSARYVYFAWNDDIYNNSDSSKVTKGRAVINSNFKYNPVSNILTAGTFKGNLSGNASTATKLGTSTVGGTTTPIYLNAGTPTALSYTISKSVPSNAVFTDANVTQTAVGSDYTNYRPLIIGASNSGTKGFSPTTTTSTTYTCSSIYAQPSTGLIHGSIVEGAVWNDLADSILVDEECNPEHGYCYCFDGEKYNKSSKYLDDGIIGIHSDTYGFKMGAEENKKKMDVAVSGFVLAYVDKEYAPGTPLTCTENGYLTEIRKEDKIEYPEKIVATYWKNEPSEEWGSEERKVKVNGRKWVKIK